MATCDGCQSKECRYDVFDSHLNRYDFCTICYIAWASDCPCCEMSLTQECYSENKLVCDFCLSEDDDSDYVPETDDCDTSSDETGSSSGDASSDTE